MSTKQPKPGVSRSERLSEEGLERLENQLARGIKIGQPILAQWIKRYGEPARHLIKKYDQYNINLENNH